MSFRLPKKLVHHHRQYNKKKKMPDRMAEIFAKLRRGEALTEQEIMQLAGHSSLGMTNAYYGDRN